MALEKQTKNQENERNQKLVPHIEGSLGYP
jgi:hypothetical protein